MAGFRLDFPWPFSLTSAALQRVGCKITWYENGTTTKVSLYSDRACTVPAANPVESVNGQFPVRFIATAQLLSALVEDTDGTDRLSANDISPFQDSVQTPSGAQPLGSGLTALEALAGTGIVRATATDTYTLDASTAAGRSVLNFTDPNADRVLIWDDSAGSFVGATLNPGLEINGTEIRALETWVVAASDETTTITTGTAKASFAFPYDVAIVSVGASVKTAGTGMTIDINDGVSSILSTKLTLDSGEKTSLTAATPAVISDAAIAAGAEVTIDVDAVSGTYNGLKVWMIVRRTT